MSLKITNIKVPIVAGVITLLAVAVMVKLGFWQLDRAAQKQALFDDYQQQTQRSVATSPVSLNLIKRKPARFERVSVQGQFDPNRYFLLDNKLQQGTPGYHVVGLLKPTTKADYIAVNLGWLEAPRLRSELPAVTLPSGTVNLEGLVKYPQENVFISEEYEAPAGTWPQRVPEFMPEQISQRYDVALAPYVVLLSEQLPFGYSRNWQPNVMPPEKHQAYALQWFSLAIAALVIFAFAVIKVNKQKQEE